MIMLALFSNSVLAVEIRWMVLEWNQYVLWKLIINNGKFF